MVLVLASISVPAFADDPPSLAAGNEPVRDDIVEIRRSREPNVNRVLGWTADGRLVVHRASCGTNDGGGEFCTSALIVTGATGQQTTTVLEAEHACSEYEPTCAFPWRVPTALASDAIKRERAALAALGPLARALPATEVTVSGDVCWVKVLERGTLIATVMHLGEGECTPLGGNLSIWGAKLVRAVTSPDGKHVGAVLSVKTKFTEYWDEQQPIAVYTRP